MIIYLIFTAFREVKLNQWAKPTFKLLSNMKFDSKNPKYKVIKITNIVLIILFFFIEIIAQEAQWVKTPNGAPVVITFLISRYIVRKMFTSNPDFSYKIIKTFGIWLGVIIAKGILAIILFSLVQSIAWII